MIGSVISDYAAHISGSRSEKMQSEDPLSKSLLRQKLCEENSKRAVLFAVPSVIISVIFSVVSVVNMKSDTLAPSVFSLAGLLLMMVGCGGAAVPIYREYEKKKTDLNKSEKLVFCFWGIYSAAAFLLTVSDFSVNIFVFRFCLYLAVMTVFPLFGPKKSLCFVLPYFGFTSAAGVFFGADVSIYIFSVGFVCGYLIVSALVYSSFCCLFLGERQLDTANERCRQINEKDGLTGLLNKKGLIKRLTDIIEGDADSNIAAVFFDIDDFRSYNRIYTDAESDECLYNICNCVRIVAKPKTDIISRYGGDDFVIIVRDTDEYNLIYFAEQIRKSVERMALPFEEGKIVTVSVGVSQIVEGKFTDYSKLLKEAEDSLALAKSGGKNCIGYMGNVFRAENDKD